MMYVWHAHMQDKHRSKSLLNKKIKLFLFALAKQLNYRLKKRTEGVGSNTNNDNRYKCNNNTSALVQRPNTQETERTTKHQPF